MASADVFRLSAWQWTFGAVSPAALILLNLWLFAGNIVGVAPAGLWLFAIAGPIVLIASQHRFRSDRLDSALTGAVAICAIAAFAGFALPPAALVFFAATERYYNSLLALLSTLIIGIFAFAVLLSPLLGCARAYWRQAWLRSRSGTDLNRGSAVVGALAICAVIVGGEILDRRYLEERLELIRSNQAEQAIVGLRKMTGYPLNLFARRDDVCEALYNQIPDSFIHARHLRASLSGIHAEDAGRVRREAQRILGPQPEESCAKVLST